MAAGARIVLPAANSIFRTDPVVIMLVTYQDKCLLGSGRDFKVPDRYSCLAGFVEPGETIEEAAKRELMEEAGVTAREVNYCFSQPWPFPSQLMIGIRIQAASMDMSINKEELTGLKLGFENRCRSCFERRNGSGASACPHRLPLRA